MKFTDIVKVARAKKCAYIINDKNKEQWISVGSAAYKLEGIPRMEAEDFLRFAGVVTEKQQNSWRIADIWDEKGVFENNRYGEVELTRDMAGISLLYQGHRLTPFYMMEGVVWVDVDYMAPIVAGKTEYLSFHIRREKNGTVIAVKDGLVLIALVSEFPMDEPMLLDIVTLCEQCKTRGAIDELRSGNIINICGCEEGEE